MRKLKKTILVLILLSIVVNPAFARRVADFDSKTDILQQVERKLAFTTDQFKKGNMTSQAAADDYLEMMNLLQSLYHQGLNYPQFKSVLRNTKDAVSKYYGCVYYGGNPVEVGKREQMILGSVALYMSELLEKAPAYIRGEASQVLEDTIPLLAEGFKDKLKSILFYLTESSDNLSRFYAVKALGQLIKSSFNPAEQDEIVRKISGFIDDEDMLVTGGTVQMLGDVLSSVEINHALRDEIISSLINLYAQPLRYPVSSYLTECLRALAGSEPEIWRAQIYEVLGKHHIINRDKTLSDIFDED